MKPIIHIIARSLFRAGGLGLLTLGVIDSSPLVIPLGNDLLVLALSARYHGRMPYYVLMATAGSLIGCLGTDWISRKSEGGLKKFVSGKQLALIRKYVEKRAGTTLVVASLLLAREDSCASRSRAPLRSITGGGLSSRLNRRGLST